MDVESKSIKNEERGRERSRRGDRPSRFSSTSRDRSPVRNRKKGGDRRVYVSNIAYESRWQDIKDLFRSEVGEVSFVELFVDENDKARGCGVVEFETPELAAKAVEKMHRFDIKGRKLVVKEDSDVERDKCGRPITGRNRGANDRESNSNNSNSRRDDPPRNTSWDAPNSFSPAGNAGPGNINNNRGNLYGLSAQFLESFGISGPLVPKVFIANLDFKVDRKKLKEVFKLAGKVVNAEISLDKDGKSRGFGTVEYEHPVEAVQAISMLHNQTLFDRRLTVRMDRVDKPDGPPKLPEGLKGIGMGLGPNGVPLTDISRSLPALQQQPSVNLANVQSLQAAAAQLVSGQTPLNAQAQISNLGALGAGLAGVSNLLGQTLNEQLANLNPAFGGSVMNNNSQQLTSAGLGSNIGSGIGIGGAPNLSNNLNNMNTGNSFINPNVGNSVAFGNSGGMGMGGGIGGYAPGRDFDSMSAALTGGSSTGFSSIDRDNFRGNNFNGSTRPVGNMGNMGNTGMRNSGSRNSDTVLISNLPPNVTWQQLRDKFREVGDVKFAEMRTKDTGVIRFGNEWEAERAVREYDRSRFEGRTIDVMLF